MIYPFYIEDVTTDGLDHENAGTAERVVSMAIGGSSQDAVMLLAWLHHNHAPSGAWNSQTYDKDIAFFMLSHALTTYLQRAPKFGLLISFLLVEKSRTPQTPPTSFAVEKAAVKLLMDAWLALAPGHETSIASSLGTITFLLNDLSVDLASA